MRIVVVHLSDIHFRDAGNPIIERVEKLASAMSSVEAATDLFIIVISGDIAYDGTAKQYALASEFFSRLEAEIRRHRPDAKIKYVCIPGNHDCFLPEDREKVRGILVNAAASSIHDPQPDESLLAEVLQVQQDYKTFKNQLTGTADSGTCETVYLQEGSHKIKINLYNTAILSRRKEIQGTLHVPVALLSDKISSPTDEALCIAVLHHSYLWLESNNATALRNHIERTTDVALMGHQHYGHDYYKVNETGEQVLYLEADALQDEKYPQTSAFQVLVFDMNSKEERSIKFRWSASERIYRVKEDSNWRSLRINRAVRLELRPNAKFQDWLQEIGNPFWHKRKGPLKLPDVFVFPDVMVRSAGAASSLREVRGEDLYKYVMSRSRILFQASGMAGKTSLAKVLFSQMASVGEAVPLFVDGGRISTAAERKILASFWSNFGDEYSAASLDAFQQLPKDRRALLVDNWSRTGLNAEGRKAFLEIAGQHFGRVLLFADELFEIQELIDQSAATSFLFDHATIQPLRHKQRGRMIEKWITMGQEHTADEGTITREVEEKERLIRGMIGKNTLPAVPFVVLSILEADQEGKAESTEAGSFGYLYEVLVTTALNATTGPKAQLEKKYVFLSILAYEMFRLEVGRIAASDVRSVAENYARSHFIKVDIESMLTDLTSANVLTKINDSYGFAYSHLYHYFVARYFKENLDRADGPQLREQIGRMADRLSSDRYSTILMFILYFARDASGLVQKLVGNADRIYSSENPAELGDDVTFLNQFCEPASIEIPETVDPKANREARRELLDTIEKNERELERPLSDTQPAEFEYNEDLSDKQKFDIAFRHIELLGQVIRNFPGSLPGKEKLAVLKSTYLLGLRTTRVVLRLLAGSVRVYRDAMIEQGEKQLEQRELQIAVDRIIVLISRMVVLGMLKKISGSIGLPDLEAAYNATLDEIGRTNATQLIDLSLKLDHFPGFPESDVRSLHKHFKNNAFADQVLSDLVTSYIAIFGVDRKTRQSMAALFKVDPNSPQLMDPSRKK